MKKFLLIALLGLSFAANAQHRCCWRGGYYNGGWVAPAIIGGVIGYEIAHPHPVIVEPQPVIIQQPQQTIVVPSPAPAGYHWQQMINPATNQYQLVLVPN
jgi:hypothetical protein